MRFLMLLLSVLWVNFTLGQAEYATNLIPAELKENANAVVRLNDVSVSIISQQLLAIKTKRAVTVMNEEGLGYVHAFESYDLNRKIKKLEALILDASGREIKAFKKRDFKDLSVGDGFSFFNDNRVQYLDYAPLQYPCTVVFESEVETSNTAFLPRWSPFDGYFVSTEKSSIQIKYPEDLGFGYKEVNFAARFGVQKTESFAFLGYSASNLKALKNENSSPEFSEIAPVAYFKVEKFNLEGVNGEAKTWSDFGKWYYKTLLAGTDELPVATQNAIKQLVGQEQDPVKIAKIVYQYVQNKTRYVSIQVGIGGFKPMLASSVDKLGYGDCKALTNYTRALLEAVGVTSYYAVVHSGKGSRKGIQEDFVSVQGNHVILALPVKDKMLWLECTSQTIPFGFQGTFTDDRNVLLIKPEGGEIVKTQSYLEKDNSQFTRGAYAIGADGLLKGKITIRSQGAQYDDAYHREKFSEEQKERYYKDYFGHINNLKLEKVAFRNDGDNIVFLQDIELSAPAYASEVSGRLMFALNAFNINPNTPKRYRSRENPFQVNRGFEDYDEITITLPEGFEIETTPSNLDITNKYGAYKCEVVKTGPSTLTYKRTLFIRDGRYESKDYDEYRLFREQVFKNDNAKMVLKKV